MKLSRKQIKEGLQTIPIEQILSVPSKGLTPKQKTFAKEIALGSSKAEAYRRAYKPNATRATMTTEPYKLSSDPRIALEVQAYEMAIEAAKYRTPAALRELVIQSLVQVVIDPEAKQSVKVAAAKVLGTVTEVAAFTERKEVRTIKTTEDAKTQIIGELQRLMNAQAEDATIIDSDAASLLDELTRATHPSPTPQDGQQESQDCQHTKPDEPSQTSAGTPFDLPDAAPTTPQNLDTPPSNLDQVP